MNDEEYLRRTQNTLDQARGFREIVVLIMKGVADRDSHKFVAEVKEIVRQVSEKEK